MITLSVISRCRRAPSRSEAREHFGDLIGDVRLDRLALGQIDAHGQRVVARAGVDP
jgi:hypothetical protein